VQLVPFRQYQYLIFRNKIKKIKLIADVEDLWPLFLEDMECVAKLAISYMKFASNYLYKSADGIAAVSEGMLDYVKEIISGEEINVDITVRC
jgi:hypothetical protein